MDQSYNPQPPRICPACGAAVADGFEQCPTCGQSMPQQPAGQWNPTTDVPQGGMIVKDRKTYFEHYLPRQLYNNIILMAVLTQFITLILGLNVFLGMANNVPVLFIIHTLIVSALGFWVLEKADVASTVVSLIYTVLFFFISLVAFDIAYWYPIVAAVFALVAVVKGNKNWTSYQITPTPVAELSEEEKKLSGKTKKTYRIVAAVMAGVLLVMGGIMSWMKIRDDAKYENYTVGEVSGNVYTNEFAGITFTAPEGWTFMTDQELEEFNLYMFDMLYDPMTNAAIMYAENSKNDGAEFIIFYVTKHAREAVAEDYFDNVAREIKKNTVNVQKLDDKVIGGMTYQVMYAEYSYEDGSGLNEYTLVSHYGRYTFEIYVNPPKGMTLDQFLSCFAPV